MKKIGLILLSGSLIFAYCTKQATEITVQQKNENAVKGKWQFVSFTDSTRKAITSGNECWADNTLELKDNHTAVLSQGTCIETPLKAKDVEFKWVFISPDVVDMGSDTVKLIVNNDTALQFQRINKSFLEYKWKR
jgi:hypothetical protein